MKVIEVTAEYLAAQHLSEDCENRFWEKVNKTETCWLWTGATYGRGYGTISRGKRFYGKIGAHIASWILHFGPIPPALNVCHDCDNPPCMRPDHLWLGSDSENMLDMWSKGRHRKILECRGEGSVTAKLKEQEVIEIRRRHALGECQRSLAKEFGVNWRTINLIVLRINWRHI